MKVLKTLLFLLRTYLRSFAFQIKFVATGKIQKNKILQFWSSFRPEKTQHRLIRIGPEGDGGYLVPEDFTTVEAVFSPGVSDESGFELAMAEKGIPCFLADASVSGPAQAHPNISFDSKFIGAIDEGEFVRLDTWVNQKNMNQAQKLLQMDIEGYEWSVFDVTNSKVLEKFRIMIVEFHDLHKLANPEFLSLANRAMTKILQTHKVLHVHGNNNHPALYIGGKWIPQVIEVTFHTKEGTVTTGQTHLPSDLDQKNSRWLPEARIKF